MQTQDEVIQTPCPLANDKTTTATNTKTIPKTQAKLMQWQKARQHKQYAKFLLKQINSETM